MNLEFQHTAARRRLVAAYRPGRAWMFVSTHSRPKAAGQVFYTKNQARLVSTHSRPKAAGRQDNCLPLQVACFNTQPPEGGWRLNKIQAGFCVWFQHTAARRRLEASDNDGVQSHRFQHTAARRRLDGYKSVVVRTVRVSTHSRPKAAGEAECARLLNQLVSTHSRPKAAGCGLPVRRVGVEVSTHSRPKAAGPVHKQTVSFGNSFNTQPPEGGW